MSSTTPPTLPRNCAPSPPVRAWHKNYFAMYSSEWDVIVTDPRWMCVPADDHVVHRGDGVFETIKTVAGAVYALPEHLVRLLHSARTIGLAVPWSHEALVALVIDTVRAGGRPDCLIRVLLTRGPGGFGVSPAECPRPNLYVIVYRGSPGFMVHHPEGGRATIVDIPLKPGWLATVKTCNYLPNVLMKIAASARGADFPIALDEAGYLAEGATENIAIVNGRELVFPRPGRILEGITMLRVLELAKQMVADGLLTGVSRREISRTELLGADEVLVLGTTPDVTSIVSIDGQPIGTGRPGHVRTELQRRLESDQLTNSTMRTPVMLP